MAASSSVGPYGPTQYSWIVGEPGWAWAVDWNSDDQAYDQNRRKVRLDEVPDAFNEHTSAAQAHTSAAQAHASAAQAHASAAQAHATAAQVHASGAATGRE